MKTWQWVVASVVAVLTLIAVALGGLVLWGGPLADIRPEEIAVDAPQPDRETRGRELLTQALQAHGGPAAWAAHESQSFQLDDEWPGIYAWFSPWGVERATLEITEKRHSFDSVTRFSDGRRWGITGGQAWVVEGDEKRRVEDPNIQFILPTVHYFIEHPQRLQEAELVRYVGPREVRGQTYEVVYATWGSWSANDDYDQYLVFIEPDTKRIAKLQFTVRETGRPIQATIHLEDFVEAGGLTIAQRYTITGALDDDPAAPGFLHRMQVSNLRFDAEPVEGL